MDVLYVGGLAIQNHPTLAGPFSARLTTIHVYADVYMYILYDTATTTLSESQAANDQILRKLSVS